MTAEHTRRAEFAQFVSDHIFGDLYSKEGLSIVHQERLTDELWYDRAGASPGLDPISGTCLFGLHDLEVEFLVDVWAFFCASGHLLLL